ANTLDLSVWSAEVGVVLESCTGVLTWTPTEAQGPSTNLITLKVTDNGVPPSSDSRSFMVVVTEANSAPVLTVPTDRTVPELSTLARKSAEQGTAVPDDQQRIR